MSSQDSLLQQALTLHQSGDFVEAEKLYRLILSNEPNNHGALHLLGVLGADIYQDFGMAIQMIQKAISVEPNFNLYHQNLAIISKKAGRLDVAIEARKAELKFDPKSTDILNELGLLYSESELTVQAINVYKKILKIDPNHKHSYNNLGLSHYTLYKTDLAYKNLKRAITIDPDFLDAYENLGVVYMDDAKMDEAIETFEKLIAVDPDRAMSHWNLGIALLKDGQLGKGFAEYNWRWKAALESTGKSLDKPKPYSIPYWNQEPLNGKKLLLTNEQGIGDEILFLNVLIGLKIPYWALIIECDNRIRKLLERAFPGVQTVSNGDTQKVEELQPSVAYQKPTADLFSWFRKDEASFPKHEGFLKADEDLIEGFSKKYKKLWPNKILVGISWDTKGKLIANERRMDLSFFKNIAALENVQLINLQYGDVDEVLTVFNERGGGDVHIDPSVDAFNDLDSFAAQISALDLVISIDNNTIHFAGALGVPTFAVLPSVPDWKWQWEKSETCWYPSMKLFRRKKRFEAGDVQAAVEAELKKVFHNEDTGLYKTSFQ